MGQRHLEMDAEPSIDRAARRLEAESTATIARAVYDHAGELAVLEYGQPAAMLGAIRLAARRTGVGEPDRERLAAEFDVDPDRVVAADELQSRYLTPPADDDEIRRLRRRLIVAREVLAAVERGRGAGPELPGSHLADAAPFLLARASSHLDSRTDREFPGLDAAALRDHVERLEADLEFARLGTKLYRLVHEE
ncbi:hypothetical protein [Natrinema longum]|uniref:Uncharacterized protein n=1 Tax=Natrinema longum TaxID=370324 RepID=A0A8A2U6T3_9EURY|nr:hypothetical protein [Natrinema longum]MBZ6494735.1 hypothetical protein [Natrinema longum]QSW83955.1 hypothetical protein J0X27_10800 [Natrinema longum]